MNTASPLHRAYTLLIHWASLLQSPLLLLLRLYWGWQFYTGGKGKLSGHEKTAEFFTSLHIPMPGLNAWLAGGVECFGGLLLLVGLASRLTCLPLIFTMIVAYATAESESLHSLDKFTEATPFLFLLACLLILAFGPGAFSIDQPAGAAVRSRPRVPLIAGGIRRTLDQAIQQLLRATKEQAESTGQALKREQLRKEGYSKRFIDKVNRA